MRKLIKITFLFLLYQNSFCQNYSKISDYRDPFCGEYTRYFGNCAFSSTCCSSYMFYVNVEKSPTSTDSIIITDSSLVDYNPSFITRYAKLNADSTWFNSGSYYGSFKNRDTVCRVLWIPGPSTCNSCSKRVNSVGISELLYSNNPIFIYPNPANNKLSIKSHKGLQVKKLILISTQGKEVLVEENFNGEVNLNSLEEGLYFLHLITNEGGFTKKIIVQH